MQDIFNIPNNDEFNQVFYATSGTSSSSNWLIWSKPKKAKFIRIWMLGGGGGGGAGQSILAASRNGGGGGGSSSISGGIFTANLLPDILYVWVGIGGKGAPTGFIGGGGGSAGDASYVSIRPNTTTQNVVLYANGGGGSSVVGIGGGITYSTLGAPHHAQEDIAVASTIPGLRIIAPSDPAETEAATRWCAVQQDGPVYLRLGKAGEPDLTSHLKTPWTFGKWRQVVAGSDLAIITYGTIASQCVKAVHMVQEHGLFPSLYFATTIEPMDFQTIDEIFSRYRNVLIVEEHVSFGGIGMRLKALGTQLSSGLHIHLISLPNSFSHSYGKHEELLFLNNLDANSIAQRIKKISS
jgi:transketolase C-terminal domain/subunit